MICAPAQPTGQRKEEVPVLSNRSRWLVGAARSSTQPWLVSLEESELSLSNDTAMRWSSGLTENARMEPAPCAIVFASATVPVGEREWISVSPSR